MMLPPISGTPPLNRKEWKRFLKNVEANENNKTVLVPTPKLKEAERKIKEKYSASRV